MKEKEELEILRPGRRSARPESLHDETKVTRRWGARRSSFFIEGPDE